ncbi:MAG: hypothetical protein ACK4WJ_05405 [Endomicrobiia bacterium]
MIKRIYCFIFAIILFFLSLPEINLTNSDIGRHLKNGEVIIKNFSVPKTNLYSYTYPDFTFYNHHWLSGVIFYLVNKISGFKGLSIFFSIITFFTFLFFLKAVEKEINSFWLLGVIFLLTIPLICVRKEIRPEIFSYFFSSVYFFILYKFLYEEKNFLYFLPILQIIWINLHIYFVVGLVLIFFSLTELIVKYLRNKNNNIKNKFYYLSFIFVLSILSCFINPYGIKGLLLPLNIFKNYGYKVFENQSVWFIDKVVKNYIPNLNYKILTFFVLLSWTIKIKFKKIDISIFNFLYFLFFTILSLFAIRNFAIFAYFSIPVLILNFKELKFTKNNYFLFFIAILYFLFSYRINSSTWNLSFNLVGLKKGNELAAKFFQDNNLEGPILNNYDIGGYLIYYLFPKQKVFVDNRPEAYPEEFFKSIYIPMMEDETKWYAFEKIYNFNSIFFYRHDYTPFGQQFLINRVFDPTWAVVFVDQDCIILLKRNEKNKKIIEKFEISKDIFKVVKTK